MLPHQPVLSASDSFDCIFVISTVHYQPNKK
ncbi:TPA: ErmCL family antibiotic resistance leader peptide [Staphylococcus aureus]|nr:ErmCL family antibiotic resistance leader peptide [Staphylococcus aureus]HDF7886484.1 ErmCL family antibiotic resistance leader peptide [Staphylococcus aureus]